MTSDIRIKTTILSNPKIMVLIRKLDDHGFVCLLRLWCFAASNKPDGDLSAYSSEMIEAAAGWSGEDYLFFDSLCQIGFLDCTGDNKTLHDWKEHQKWVVGAPSRSENASKKVLLRWALKNLPKKQHDEFRDWFFNTYIYNTEDNTDSILAVYRRYTDSILSDTNCNTPSPSPSPSPSPNDNRRFVPPTIEQVIDYCTDRGNIIDAERWFDHYTANGWKVGKNKMKDWKAAVRTWERSEFNKAKKQGNHLSDYALELLNETET